MHFKNICDEDNKNGKKDYRMNKFKSNEILNGNKKTSYINFGNSSNHSGKGLNKIFNNNKIERTSELKNIWKYNKFYINYSDKSGSVSRNKFILSNNLRSNDRNDRCNGFFDKGFEKHKCNFGTKYFSGKFDNQTSESYNEINKNCNKWKNSNGHTNDNTVCDNISNNKLNSNRDIGCKFEYRSCNSNNDRCIKFCGETLEEVVDDNDNKADLRSDNPNNHDENEKYAENNIRKF